MVREVVGKNEDVVDVTPGTTVRELLTLLTSRYGDKFSKFLYDRQSGNPHQFLQFLVDGKNVTVMQGLDTKLPEGAEFAIIPPVGGGSVGPPGPEKAALTDLVTQFP